MMYNRYIPKADGTYQRRRMKDNVPSPPPPKPPDIPVPLPCPSPEPPRRPAPRRPRPNHYPRQENDGIGAFLKKLLPKDFDTGDLLVVLLLLLMSGDCQEDQNTALLTLALYLFM